MAVSAPRQQHLWSAGYYARQKETRRRRAVALILLIYALSLVEGPLRKWFLPGMATPLIFLRDPFVALLYAYCIGSRLIAWGRLGSLWLAMAVVTSLVGLIQFVFNGIDPAGWLLGVRTYWLYMPLAFVVAATFRRQDVERFLTWNMLLAIPYALLIAIQYNAGPTAWINAGVGGDDAAAVGLGTSIVRPFGLFTYTSPNVQFTAAMVAMFAAFLVSGLRFRLRTPLLFASGAAVGAMAVLTGSRAIYFLVAAILGLTLAGSTLARPDQRTLMRNIGILAFAGVAAVLFTVTFPDMYEAMIRRFEVAAASEGSIWNRVMDEALPFIEPLYTAPLLGHGIGLGAPGVAGYLGLDHLLYGEADLMRNVNELGVLFGLAFILLRFGTAAWLVNTSLRLARHGTLLALPLAGYAVIPIAIGQITHSPISGFLPWLFVGLLIATIGGASYPIMHGRPR